MKTRKTAVLHEETAYIFATVILALSVAMLAAADFGVSMIVAPAYIISLKFPGIFTFGQAEYLVQGLLFIIMCLLLKRIRILYFLSFASCLVYGLVLDLLRAAVPLLNPDITPSGSLGIPLRITLFIAGELLTAISISVFFRVYLYPQVYDFFVRIIARRFNFKLSVFKTAFDVTFLILSCVMTLLFFGRFQGIGIGTVVATAVNGPLIGFFGKIIDRFFVFKPFFPALSARFE
ncbi:MAG: DUF6198 family protein [Firmicutes bacterium]|nr:DUF6198 family protein [Bacillota bacterium]